MIRIEDFTDIRYEVIDGVAVITINRPDRYNALRGRTVDELIYAFRYAWVDRAVGAIILTGAGEKAFCSGGDQKERAQTGGYGETEMGMFEIERLHKLIREVPKPRRAPHASARSARASAPSTPASAAPTSPASSERSAPARSGSSAISTTPRPPSAGAW